MNKVITLLSGLLAVQVLLILVFQGDWGSSQTSSATQLLAVSDTDSVDRIEIHQEDKALVLKRDNDQWIMPEHHQLPVSRTKLEKTLTDLTQLKRGWAVAKTASAAERFEVSEDQFKKRIDLLSGDKRVSTLYIGTSPGFRKVHVRAEGDKDIFPVNLSDHSLSSKPFDWLDKKFLRVDDKKLQSLEYGDITLMKAGDQWKLKDQAEEETLVDDNVKALVKATTALNLSGFLDQEKTKAFAEESPVATLNARLSDKTVEFRFYQKDDDTVVKSSLSDQWFTVAKHQVDAIKDLNRVSLVKTQEEEDETSEVSDALSQEEEDSKT